MIGSNHSPGLRPAHQGGCFTHSLRMVALCFVVGRPADHAGMRAYLRVADVRVSGDICASQRQRRGASKQFGVRRSAEPC